MNAFLFIIGIVLIVVGIVFLRIGIRESIRRNKDKENDPESKKITVKRWPVAAMIAGILFIILSQSFRIVPTGHTGVRSTFGLIDQESCKCGFNGLIPFVQHISLVNNKQQDLTFAKDKKNRIWAEASEQTVVYMENVQVTYQIVPESSAWIYANVDNWVKNLIDENITASALKSAARSLDVSIVTDRGTIEPLAIEHLQAAVNNKYGENRVLIKNIVINNIDFDDSYNEAIAKKSQAMQEQQEQEIRNKTMIDMATAEAEAKRQAAQGEADAELIRAKGKAKANEIISKSITSMTQKQDIIDSWNGELPKYSGLEAPLFGIIDQPVESDSVKQSSTQQMEEQPLSEEIIEK